MKSGSVDDLLGMLRPGMNVFVQGAIGEPMDFCDAIAAEPGRFAGVTLWACLIPGINAFDYAQFDNGPNLVTFMASPALAAGLASGRTHLRPIPYSEIPAALARPFDVAILQVTPPDKDGLCSFGLSSDSAPLAWPQARTRVAFINEAMPRPPRAETIPARLIDLSIITQRSLHAASTTPPRPLLQQIGARATPLIPDGASIQSGIGEAPGAVIAALQSRNLVIRSGIITNEYRRLAEAGQLAANDAHITGVAWGSDDFYQWLADSDLCAFRPIPVTHGADSLRGIERFTSINSALEVDLAGNLNVEWLGDKRISSVGGALDFMKAAAASPGGRSIVALPAASRGISRIVPRLSHTTIAGLTDTVITEHGAAQLKGLSPENRANALISIAAPELRPTLEAAR